MKSQQTARAPGPAAEAERTVAAAGQVCTTVVDDVLEAQLNGGPVCTTVVDELLEAQLEAAQG
jgi:hypothetical protein